MSKIIFALSLILVLGSFKSCYCQNHTIETVGDITQLALPASSVAMLIIKKDKKGVWQYAKACGTTILVTRILLPSNLPAAIYFIGNGGTTLLLSSGFFIAGKIKNDYRMQTTSSELVEVLISTGLVSQTFKRITGRRSPTSGIIEKNSSFQWIPFPSFKAYQNHTPEYDAMPSGHLMTYMASLTVIATNYSEVKWIKPVGYSLAVACFSNGK